MRQRASGILLHPTSLAGPFGVGDLGPQAIRFVDCLADAGFSLWQMLPLTVPGAFHSPYDCRSAFAGSPLLISPELLVAAGLLTDADRLPTLPHQPADLVAADALKHQLLRSAWATFRRSAPTGVAARLHDFRTAAAQRYWLDDWALFAALGRTFEGHPWQQWPDALRRRQPQALDKARCDLAGEIAYEEFLQFLFFEQFEALRRHAESRGVTLCGDLPMYVAIDGADTWARPDLFELEEDGGPRAVAGVPPDAFSASGQLWGNPVYDWRRHRDQDYSWWIERIRTQTRLTPRLRLDHFRGFLAYWRIPTGAADATSGRWTRGPGHRLFEALTDALGEGGWIAEDLGVITPAVEQFRDRLGAPGMRVLQFGFDDGDGHHLPHRYRPTDVAYSGTHDNGTLIGWLGSLDDEAEGRVLGYLGLAPGTAASTIARHLIHALMQSVAGLVILPFQEILGLGDEARMNTPGTVYDNWRWRMPAGSLDSNPCKKLETLLVLTDRAADQTRGSGG